MKINIFCNAIMPFEDSKILESNQYLKSDKAIKKIDGCKNNPENSSRTKK